MINSQYRLNFNQIYCEIGWCFDPAGSSSWVRVEIFGMAAVSNLKINEGSTIKQPHLRESLKSEITIEKLKSLQ